MARKRSGGRGGRSKGFRKPAFRVTCSACGKVDTVPVRPDPGIELTCVQCLAAKSREAAKAKKA